MSLSLDNAVDSLGSNAAPQRRLRPVRIWLYVLAVMVVFMVAVGGLTRLTDSGLSITEWKPITGAIPPLSDADWQSEFELYKQIPEFQLQNYWMDLAAFKYIYWWEWAHRFLGRVLGLVFAVPFVVFLFQKRLPKTLVPWLVGLFILGGFQGALGWWMVSSGLTERVDVSQYRLAAHLSAASLLLFALVFVARLVRPVDETVVSFSRRWRWAISIFAVLVFIQIVLGAFVAGTDAGYAYNTWPLMEGKWIPDGLWVVQPAWLNMFETLITVQFVHRMFAYALVAAAVILFVLARLSSNPFVRVYTTAFLGFVLLQTVLGIFTLIHAVPLPLALGHQSLAFMLFALVGASLADGSGILLNRNRPNVA